MRRTLQRFLLLVSLPLSLTAFDPDLFREDSRSPRTHEAVLALGEDVVRKKKRILHKPPNVIPPWMCERKARLRMKVNHLVNKSKDPRDSDQRKIRRKFNNM